MIWVNDFCLQEKVILQPEKDAHVLPSRTSERLRERMHILQTKRWDIWWHPCTWDSPQYARLRTVLKVARVCHVMVPPAEEPTKHAI